jgi:hypothetical protein
MLPEWVERGREGWGQILDALAAKLADKAAVGTEVPR